MADLDRVKRNVARMVSLNAPEADIDAYIASEGTSIDEIRSYKVAGVVKASADPSRTMPATADPGPDALPDMAKSLVAGVGRGAINMAALPATAEQMYAKAGEGIQSVIPEPARRVAGAIADYGGPLAMPLRMFSGGPTNKPTQEDITNKVERVVGPLYQPQTTAGEYANAIGEFIPGGWTPGGLARKAANVVVPAVTGETMRQAYKGTEAENIASIGGTVAASLATNPLLNLGNAIGRGLSTPVRAYANPQGFAAQKFEEAVARDFPLGGVERFASKADDMRGLNSSARVMDAGGENVRGLMRSAADMPNEVRDKARRMLDTRQGTQYARLEDDLGSGFRLSGQNYYDDIEKLSEEMARIGKTKIEPALRIETPMTPTLESILKNEKIAPIVKEIQARQALEGSPVGLETRTQMLHQLKVEIDKRAKEAKAAMDAKIDGTAGQQYRTYSIAHRRLLDEIDNPAYKDALKKYADQASLDEAARKGYDFFGTMQPEEIRKTLKTFDTDVEQNFFRLGAMRYLVERVRKGNAMNDRTDGVFSSPEIQMKLRAVLPDQKAYREVQKQLTIEAKMADSRKAIQGNSKTNRFQIESEEAGRNAEMAKSAVNAATGAATGRLQPVFDFLARGYQRATGMNPRVAAELLNLGMAKDPSAILALARQNAERAAMAPVPLTASQRAVTSGANAFAQQPDPELGLFGVVRPERRPSNLWQ